MTSIIFLAIGFAPYGVSAESLSLVGIKMGASAISQIALTNKINATAVVADDVFIPGYGDFVGSFYEGGYKFDETGTGFYQRTILGNKSISTAAQEGAISTMFSAGLRGLDVSVGSGNIPGKALYGSSIQFSNYAPQKKYR